MLTDKELDFLYEYTETMITLQEAYERIRRIQMSVKYAPFLLKVGEVPPKEVLETVCAEYNSAYGFAYAEGDNIQLISELGSAEAEGLMGYLNEYKDKARIFWLAKSNGSLQEKDLQPFVLVKEDEKIILVACLTGSFGEYEMTGSSHTNEYHCVDKRLRPKALKLWRGNDSDLDKFTNDIDETIEDLSSICPENSSIVYMLASGKMWDESKPEDRCKEFPWGWAYGSFEDKQAEPPKVDSGASKLQSLKRKTPTEDKSKTETHVGEVVTSWKRKDIKKEDFVPVKKKDSDDDFIGGSDDLWTRPPTETDTKERLHKHYMDAIGYVPRNWKQRPWYVPQNQNTVKLGDLKNSTVLPKDVGTKYVTPPLIPTANVLKDFAANKWPGIKILGYNSEFIADPTKIMEDEQKRKSAAAMLSEQGLSNFINHRDFYMPHAQRCMFLSLCSGPNADANISLVSAIWGDMQWACIDLEKKNKANEGQINNQAKVIKEKDDKIKELTDKLEKFQAKEKQQDDPPAEPEAASSKLKSLRKLK